jgi:DNA-binding transcriptional LysR family regulator
MGIRNVVNAAARKVRKNLNVCFEIDSVKLMQELVEQELGYAILPYSYFRSAQTEGRLRHVPIANPVLSLTTYLSRRNYHPTNPTVANVIENAILEFMRSEE